MKNMSVVLVVVFLFSCASTSPEGVINRHREYKDIVLPGSYKDNFARGLAILRLCYKNIDQTMTNPLGMETGKLLEAKVTSGEDYEGVWVGNFLMGGIAYYKYSSLGDDTKFEAYGSLNLGLYRKYVSAIENKDPSHCN